MSIFWRAAAHDWKKKVTKIELGPYLEHIRLWLLGMGPFPRNAALLVTLADDNKDVFSIITPLLMEKRKYHSFIFYVPGIEFALCAGKSIEPVMRKFCLYGMANRPIGITSNVTDRLNILVARMVRDGRSGKLARWVEREKKSGNEYRLKVS
jgi:hypothetical protein